MDYNVWIERGAFILLLIATIVMVFILIKLSTDGGQCVADPISYAEKVSNTTCYCLNHLG